MNKILVVSLIAGLFSISYAENEFDNFKKQLYKGIYEEQKEFQEYKKQIEKEFLEYKKIVYEEFERYKKEINNYWDKAEISSKKKFVEYSKDYSVKKVVDFEKGEIRIEIIDEKKPDIKKFAYILRSLITEDKETAFKNDKLSKRIEEKLKKKVKHLKTAKVEKEPLIMDMLVDKQKPTIKDINKTVVNLLKKAKFGSKQSKKQKGKNIFSLKIKLPPKKILVKAKKYKVLVNKYAEKYKLAPELILAIIHTESSFNPLARSWVPAYGLMQIVPHTAGKDATAIIYGKPVLLSPSYLYNDKNNILVGATYIYILYYKYLKAIKNPKSRLYCTIAAYNTGAGNVAKAFTGTTSIKKAVKVINKKSPSEVYNILLEKLPYKETKLYLKRVTKRIGIYQNI